MSYTYLGWSISNDSDRIKEVEKLALPIIVYNLEVEDNRTYYVREQEVLVHNMCAKATKGISNLKSQRWLDAETKLKNQLKVI